MVSTIKTNLPRHQRIGSADIPAILGISQYASIHDVWLKKTGLVGEEPESEAMMHGNLIEPIVGRIYEIKKGAKLRKNNDTFAHPQFPFVTATPDFFDVESGRIIEAKVCGPRTFLQYGQEHEPAADAVPLAVQTQVQYQMGVLGHDVADVAACFATSTRIYTLKFDAELFDIMLRQARRFWRLVETKTPPQVDGKEGAANMLKALFPKAVSDARPARAEELEAVQALVAARAEQAKAEQAAELAKQRIQTMMADTEAIWSDTFRLRWKHQKNGQRPFVLRNLEDGK